MNDNFLLNKELSYIHDAGLYRQLSEIIPGNDSDRQMLNGKAIVNFASNDYLGLASDARLIGAVKKSSELYGVGAGASRLISGNYDIHSQLEEKIAGLKRQQAALVFPTGYMANLGCIITLMHHEEGLILADKLIHASLFDACRFSRATLRIYQHNDPSDLKKVLERFALKKPILIVTDGVFSMDGDIAPLPEICGLAKEYNASVMVDDAHATGVLGKRGAGTADHFGLENDIDIHMGTLSKACGVLGGFIAGKNELKEFLINKGRSFIYTTGIPPLLCAASIKAIEIIESEPWRRDRLFQVSGVVRNSLRTIGFNVIDGITPIVPVIIGDNNLVVSMRDYLAENGILVGAVRYPTVPEGEARLRISLQAVHSDEDIENLVSVMKKSAEKFL